MSDDINECRSLEVVNLEPVTISNIHDRSETTQEIINRNPDFTEKWALYLFLGILLILFSGTWFISYPDIIQTRATLSAYNGPKEIVPLQTGRLTKLFVHNGQQVHQGDLIGWIESTANPEEVLDLSKQLDSSIYLLAHDEPGKVAPLFNVHFQNLGDLQSYYQTYVTALQQFNDYLVNGFYQRRKNLLLNDLSSITRIDKFLLQQKEITEKDYELSMQTFLMNEQLYKDKVISAEEYRKEQSRFLNKQMGIPQINASIFSNRNQERSKIIDLEQLEHDVSQQKTTFQQALQTLKSNVDSWKQQYILTAPITGIVSFNQPIQQDQFLKQGSLFGYVNPVNSQFYAEIYLPQSNLGKIDSGMQVQLRFDAYPYQEVGFVKGRLNFISKVLSDSGYLAIVELDAGLETNQHIAIQYKNGLKADALIFTKNLRLLQRFYYNFVKATSVGRHKN
jgi:multidrug resistance efflux pump